MLVLQGYVYNSGSTANGRNQENKVPFGGLGGSWQLERQGSKIQKDFQTAYSRSAIRFPAKIIKTHRRFRYF